MRNQNFKEKKFITETIVDIIEDEDKKKLKSKKTILKMKL